MTNEVKTRLFVTAIVAAMVTLYVGPIIVSAHYDDVRQALLQSCYKEIPLLDFSFCWDEAERKAGLLFWNYLLPYIPAGAILWLNWLIKPDLRLTEESYPKRTMTVLLWIGLLVAALGIWLPISRVISRVPADMFKINSSQTFFWGPWFAAAWLIAPILFHHLVAPVSLAGSMRKGKIAFKIALWLLTATPIVALVYARAVGRF